MELGQRLQSWLFEADFFTDMVSWATPRARAAVDLSTSENSLAMTALHHEFEALSLLVQFERHQIMRYTQKSITYIIERASLSQISSHLQ